MYIKLHKKGEYNELFIFYNNRLRGNIIRLSTTGQNHYECLHGIKILIASGKRKLKLAAKCLCIRNDLGFFSTKRSTLLGGSCKVGSRKFCPRTQVAIWLHTHTHTHTHTWTGPYTVLCAFCFPYLSLSM